MKFSIILMSRNRELLLNNLLKSIEMTSFYDNEVFVGCDLDVTPYSNTHSNFSKSNVTFVYSQRNANLHHSMNRIAKMTTGDFLFILNDDCVLTELNWDLNASKLLNPMSYGKTYDDSIDRVASDYAAFPIIGREAYNRLGFVMDESFGNHGTDVIMHRIFNSAGLVVDLPCVKIKHTLHNSNEALTLRKFDSTAVEMIGRTMSAGFDVRSLYEHDITEQVRKLNAAL